VNGTTNPLLVAYGLKDKDLIRSLLNFGADPSLKDLKEKKCMVELVLEGKNESMLQLLSDSFMQALVQNNLMSIRQYIAAGFDLNLNNNNNNSSGSNMRISIPDNNSYLHWACMYSSESVIRLLLESGASVKAVNKYGATPLHEAVTRKTNKEETLRIVETLLIYKSDAVHVKGTSGVYKDLSPLDLAHTRFTSDPEIYNQIRDFLSDVSSLNSTSSQPNSPNSKLPPPTAAATTATHQGKTPVHTSHSGAGDHAADSSSFGGAYTRSSSIEHDGYQNWFTANDLTQPETNGTGGSKAKAAEPAAAKSLKSLLWPQPQSCYVISEHENDRFYLPNVKAQPIYIYFKPPYTYMYMDLVNKLASAFSGIVFYCIHKPMTNTPYVCVNIDKNLFQRENEYSILTTHNKVEINATDSLSLQYAFFTFMQICKIYARQSIPSLRVR
jgi:hypothetical protein